MAVLDQLKPQKVFQLFEEMCAIPHGSRNTKAISDWCVEFAKARNLEYHQDQANNVIIIQEASAGYEHAAPIILQGHLDMVCEKEADCTKDMEKDGLDLMIDGDLVRAVGTTLGADDGIAVAMALAILDDTSLPHPRLEVLLTTDEEIGMLGAADLDVTPLQGRQLLNLDCEEEGVFTVSCAGGGRACCAVSVDRAAFDGAAVKVQVSGLAGGHSGMEIDKGRGNAAILVGRLLRAMGAVTEIRLVSAGGGMKDNVIPTAAEAVVVAADAVAAKAAAEALAAAIKNEYAATEATMEIVIADAVADALPLDAASTSKALCLLLCTPNGVQEMSQDIKGLVQTSLNLGILKLDETTFSVTFCVRSAVATQKEMLFDRLHCLTEQLGGTVEITGTYPAWEYRRESALRDRMTEVFRAQFGKEPRIEAVHGGLECGLLCGKLPDLDCVSTGPDLANVHTPREQMSISSVQRMWEFVLEVLKQSK